MQIPELYKLYLQFPSIQTDTRKVKEGDMFFALKGPNFNGNQFAQEALAKGAAYAVADEFPENTDDKIILCRIWHFITEAGLCFQYPANRYRLLR
jgi:UDP-N-acetylmuramoyl-tripeptide--D-alanyl-D-alanine ligase